MRALRLCGEIPLQSSSPEVPRSALEELLAIYRAVEEEIAALGVACRQCGECCDFRRDDYRLYASTIEIALVLARGGTPHLTDSGACGFLVEGRCSIHSSRPLGCRVFFCDPAHKAREQDLCHAAQQRLRALTDKYGLPWGYRPFF